MGGHRWSRLASVLGAGGAVVAGVAVNQVGGDSTWPWQVAMAVIALIAVWLAASLSQASVAKESGPSRPTLAAPEEMTASDAVGKVVQDREICGDINMGHSLTSALPVPRQLPAHAASFVGRDTDLAALDALLADNAEARAVVISAITGSGGVGKTTLAVHWAHRIREQFPDGNLFVNLRGYDPGQPMTPQQALDGFLRALDVPAEKIPSELDAQAALFRSLLDGRRLLVVLDNAANVEQVRPLLPAAGGCLAIITSRSRLSGLATREGVSRVPIDVLSPDESLDLLRRVIGDTRVDAETNRASELARHCGYLPLALRIAADRAVTHPYLTLADLVEELVNDRDRLDMLASDDDATTAIRAVFSWSYKRLSPNAARVFRILGLNPGPDLSTEAASALTGLTWRRAQRLLDLLVGQHLLEQTGRNRYRFHDLLRVYAAERAEVEESEAERSIAVGRLLDWYMHTGLTARRITHPNGYEPPTSLPDFSHPPLALSTSDQALDWWQRERTNLVAVIRQCAELGCDAPAWKLAHIVVAFLLLAWYPDDCRDVLRIGDAAARRLGDQHAQALMLLDTGELFDMLGRFHEAIDSYQQALPLSQRSGAPWIEGHCQNGLGLSYRELGRFDVAIRHLQAALATFRKAGDRRGEGCVLENIGITRRGLGKPEEAISYYRQALPIFEETKNDLDRADTLHQIGIAHYDLGHFDEAIRCYRQVLNICREKRNQRYSALTFLELGRAQLANHKPDAAYQSWQKALAIADQLGGRLTHEIQTRLAAFTAGAPDANTAPGEALAAILRSWRAGSNTVADHIAVRARALEQIPDEHRHGTPW